MGEGLGTPTPPGKAQKERILFRYPSSKSSRGKGSKRKLLRKKFLLKNASSIPKLEEDTFHKEKCLKSPLPGQGFTTKLFIMELFIKNGFLGGRSPN